MNFLLSIGFLMIVGYTAGWIVDKIGLPKVIGYIATGIAFSPHSFNFVASDITESTHWLLEICLAFIAFEVGGELKLGKLRSRQKEIISITIAASLMPFFLISGGVILVDFLSPGIFLFQGTDLYVFALILGSLASPTAPAATLAVIHQYRAKGKVTDTILGVAALDDILGILLFSTMISIISIFSPSVEVGIFGNPMLNSIYSIFAAIALGMVMAFILDFFAKVVKVKGESQWVIIVFAMIITCAGLSKWLLVDELLAYITMGMLVANKSNQQEMIFGILERYTEDLIFLFFFVISGLHLDLTTIPESAMLILFFVVLRILGKFIGTSIGARIVGADPAIRKYTAGGLLPQAGIVIGLVLSVYGTAGFEHVSQVLLTTIMGATVVHELIGPLAAKYVLGKAGEINDHS